MKCPRCEYDDEGEREGRHHQKRCPRESDAEWIKELEEALTLARFEVNRVLDFQMGRKR